MNYSKFLIKISLLCLMATSSLIAQFDYGFEFSKAGSAGLQSLKIDTGARETALAGAVSSIVDGANSVFWNVAGIADIKDIEVSGTHSNWLVDSKHFSTSVAFPVASFAVALSATSFQISDFEETTALAPDGTGRMVSAGDIVIGLSIAKRFTDHLTIGGQIKYVQETLDDYSFDNVLFDIGSIYNTGWRNLRLGFSLQHFGTDMKLVTQEFRTPLLFKIGASDNLINSENLILTLAAELVHPTDNNEYVNIGAELEVFEYLFLRSGYRINADEGNFRAGVGFELSDIGLAKIKVDYAYTSFSNVFNSIHTIGVGLSF